MYADVLLRYDIISITMTRVAFYIALETKIVTNFHGIEKVGPLRKAITKLF